MANTIRRTILNEGTRYTTIHWYFESDGNEGELNDYVLLDVTNDFQVPIPQQKDSDGVLLPPEITIRKVWFSTAWFDIILGFQSVVNDYYVTLARDADFDLDFTFFQGVADRTSSEFFPTGNLICKTRDFAPLGSSGFMVLELRKD